MYKYNTSTVAISVCLYMIGNVTNKIWMVTRVQFCSGFFKATVFYLTDVCVVIVEIGGWFCSGFFRAMVFDLTDVCVVIIEIGGLGIAEPWG